MPFIFHSTTSISNLKEYRQLNGGLQALSGGPFHKLAANYISSLAFINWLFYTVYGGKGKMRRGFGEVEAGGFNSNITTYAAIHT